MVKNKKKAAAETDYQQIYTSTNSINDIPRSLRGYYAKRYSLFSRFDEGIQLDHEGWFSVTPEILAVHVAERLACEVVVDAFCGVGGNAIQFSRTCRRVIAIDNNPQRLAIAKHNAEVYGCTNIEFVLGDALKVLPTIQADVVFLSPPWGGPGYQQSEIFLIDSMPLPASQIFSAASQTSSCICLYMPKNSCLEEMRGLAEGAWCELEYQWMNDGCKALCGYYGWSRQPRGLTQPTPDLHE